MVWELESVEAVAVLEAWEELEESAAELDGLDSHCHLCILCPNPCCTRLLDLHLGIHHSWKHHPKHSNNIFCWMDLGLVRESVWVSVVVSDPAWVLEPEWVQELALE